MRLAIMISFGLAVMAAPGHAGDALKKVEVWMHVGYVVSQEQAEKHRAMLLDSIPGIVRVDGFWTPTDQDVAVADRAFHDYIRRGIRDPESIIPDLYKDAEASKPGSPEFESREFQLIIDNYDEYQRQYVGIIIDGTPLVFCNYSHGPKFDAANGYIYMQKVFEAGGSVQFLQCRFEPISKTCSNISLIGSWQNTR